MRLRRDETGATAIEYAVIGALIGIGLVGSLLGTKTSLSSIFTKTATQMASSSTTSSGGSPSSARSAYWQAKTLQANQPVYYNFSDSDLWQYKFTDGSVVSFNKSKQYPTMTVVTQDPVALMTSQMVYTNGVVSSVNETTYSDAALSNGIRGYAASLFDANGVPTMQNEGPCSGRGCTLSSTPVTQVFKDYVAATTGDFNYFKAQSGL